MEFAQVSAGYFPLFGVPIVRGRAFSQAEDSPNAAKVALLSERLWERRFQRRNMLGQSISLSGEPYTVIGVIGQSFDISEFGPNPDVWVPFQLDPNAADQGHYFQVAGKLKAGVSVAQASARLKVAAEEYKQKIDPSGHLATGEAFSDIAELKRILVASHKLEFYRCLTEKLLTYALGRGMEYYDVPTVDKIVANLDRNHGAFSTLLTGVIESAPFQQQRLLTNPIADAPSSAPSLTQNTP